MENISVLHLDDEESSVGTVRDQCETTGRALGCSVAYNHVRTASELEGLVTRKKPDLLIVDLRLAQGVDDRSGWEVVEAWLGRSAVPVVVYSGYASAPPKDALINPLVAIVKKGEEGLATTLSAMMKVKLSLNVERGLILQRMDEVTLETARRLLGRIPLNSLDEKSLSSLVRARLASLLVHSIGSTDGSLPSESVFVYPPLQLLGQVPATVISGDFVSLPSGPNSGLWWIVSPTCDLIVQGSGGRKLESALAVRCHDRVGSYMPPRGPLREQLAAANGNPSSELSRRLRDHLRGKVRDGSAYILKCTTALFGTEYLLVDFKDYRTIRLCEIEGLGVERVATMSSPYLESMRAAFFADLSRVGTPDTSGNESLQSWVDSFCAGSQEVS